MKLILRSRVEHLGDAGDLVNVRNGYGRNYLLPQGLAFEATPGNIRILAAEQEKRAEKSRRDLNEAKRRASQLGGISLVFRARAAEGEEGKLFGSVTNADIAERLNGLGKLDFEVDRRNIHLDEPLRHLGTFRVAVRLHAEVEPELEIQIEREGD